MIMIELIRKDTTVLDCVFKDLKDMLDAIEGFTFTHFITDSPEAKQNLLNQGFKEWLE